MTRKIALYSVVPGCGKTTIAQELASNFGFQRRSFASPGYAMLRAFLRARAMTDLEIDDLFRYGKESPMPGMEVSVRQFMTSLLNDWAKPLMGESVWADTLITAFHRCQVGTVIDDLRFPVEYAALHKDGWKMVRVVRHDFLLPKDGPKHPSDGALESYGFHATVTLDGGLDSLTSTARGLLKTLGMDA